MEFSGYLVEFILLCTHHCFYLATQSCPALSYLLDYSPPGSSVHGLFQARLLEWVAISFSSAFRQYYLPNSKKKNSVSLCRFLYVLKFHPYPALLSVTYRKRVQYFKDKFSLILFLYLNTHIRAHTHNTHTCLVQLDYFWPGKKVMQKQLKKKSPGSMTPPLIC